MTDKEKLEAIRAEIHRLVDVRGYDKEMANDLFTFMNSLPNEHVSNDLEEASKKYSSCIYLEEVLSDDDREVLKERLINTFKAGAQWQKQQTIDKACEWLKENKDHPLIGCEDVCLSGYLTDEFIEYFKKAMLE